MVDKINEMATKENAIILCKTSNLEKYDNKIKLEMGESLEEICNNIFTLLRKVDKYKANLVIIEGVEKEGLGLAIMNRLLRACAHSYIEI